jgi:hypothetical protein
MKNCAFKMKLYETEDITRMPTGKVRFDLLIPMYVQS